MSDKKKHGIQKIIENTKLPCYDKLKMHLLLQTFIKITYYIEYSPFDYFPPPPALLLWRYATSNAASLPPHVGFQVAAQKSNGRAQIFSHSVQYLANIINTIFNALSRITNIKTSIQWNWSNKTLIFFKKKIVKYLNLKSVSPSRFFFWQRTLPKHKPKKLILPYSSED